MTTPDPETLRWVANAIEKLLPWDGSRSSCQALLLARKPLMRPRHPCERIFRVLDALPDGHDWWLRAAIDKLRAEADGLGAS